MSTATMTRDIVGQTDHELDIRRRQKDWDRFFEQALAGFDDPNPDLCRDLAMDKTIRALGHRPRAPLTEKEREDLEIQRDVAVILGDAASVSSNHELIEQELLAEMRICEEDELEAPCGMAD